MGMTVSRYLLIGKQAYRNPASRVVRLAYSARTARLITLDAELAAHLEAGELAPIAAGTLRRLADLQAVVDAAEDELASVVTAYREGAADPGLRTFTIMPTSYCNMACDYCGQEHVKAAASRERMDRVISRVEAVIADPRTSAVTVTWFGGEPLLALRVIREMSARFVAAAQAAGTSYQSRMATNGSLLSPRNLAMLHRDCKLTAMDVTIDGPQAVHDERRAKRNGTGSFRRIIAVLAEAVRGGLVPGLQIGIRVNIDSRNEDCVADLITSLAGSGLAGPQVSLHLAPVHSWGNDVSKVELEARRYAQREARWLELAESLGIGFGCLPAATRNVTCMATSTHGELIDPAGTVYSCSEHPLVPGARDLGIVTTVSELRGSSARPRGQFDDWYDQMADEAQQCSRCPLLPVCGGRCPKLWREGHLPCPSVKFNWPQRMDLAARRLGYEPAGPVAARPGYEPAGQASGSSS